MDLDKLEKEAEEKYCKVDREFIACQDEGEVFNIGYVLGAEPREKRIEELIALINAERKRQEECDDVHLRKIAELEEENTKLKAQIEKMKCCVVSCCEGCERLPKLYKEFENGNKEM